MILIQRKIRAVTLTVIAVSVALFGQSAFAVDVNFDNGAGDGVWETATNWDADLLPVGGVGNAGDKVFIKDGSTVSLSSSQPVANAFHDIGIGIGASGVGTLNHSAGTINTTDGWFWVGHETATGTYNLTGNAKVVSRHMSGDGHILVGSGGGNGTLTMADTSSLDIDGLRLATDGTNGVANFTMGGNASVSLAKDFDVANGDGAVATANINGGTLETNAIFVNRGGSGSSATVNQTAGTVTSNNWIAIGASGGGTKADYNISGGTVISAADWFTVGENASGTLNASGNANIQANGNGMVVGRNDNGAGTFSIDGSNVSISVNSLLVDFNTDLENDPMGASGTLDFTADSSGVSVIQSNGDVTFGDNALLAVDLSLAPAGDVPLVNVMGTNLTGTFFGLAEGAIVPNSGGRTITYKYAGTGYNGNDIALIGGGAVPTLACDSEPDMDCDLTDMDALYAVFGASGGHGKFDFDGDGDVDTDDIKSWLSAASVPANSALLDPADELMLGDVNFDGDINSGDLGLLLNNFGSSSGVGWGGGDLNGDRNVNSSDLGLLLNTFGHTSAAGVNAVPEPDSVVLLSVALLCFAGMFTRRRSRRLGLKGMQ